MSGVEAIQELVDVTSEGGNLLLNVGPDEAGNIPDLQMKCLEYMAEYMTVNKEAIQGTEPVKSEVAQPIGVDKGAVWVRWTRKGSRVFAFVMGDQVKLPAAGVDFGSAKLLSGEKVQITDATVDLRGLSKPLYPVCIEFAQR